MAISWDSRSGLTGNCVVVTGAAGGIGAPIARGFAEAGAKVLLVDRSIGICLHYIAHTADKIW